MMEIAVMISVHPHWCGKIADLLKKWKFGKVGYEEGKRDAYAEAGDLISIKAARETAQRIFSDPVLIHAVDTTLKNTPVVAAEPVKHGRWIPLEYDGYADGNPVWDLWECSECREEHSGDEDTLTPYCPHCGARMDGDGNG